MKLRTKTISFPEWREKNPGILGIPGMQEIDCDRCGGTGIGVNNKVDCYKCDGTGTIIILPAIDEYWERRKNGTLDKKEEIPCQK